VGAEGDLKEKKGDLKQDRKGLYDSVEIPSDEAVENLLSVLPSFLPRATTVSPRLVVPDPLLAQYGRECC
jgi:hypothetical protein